MSESPFQPGTEVWILTHENDGSLTRARESKVAKVYKTGNFVLEGDALQWRNFGNGRAVRARHTHFSREAVYLPSPEIEAAVAHSRRLQKAKQAVREMERWLNLRSYASKITDEDANALEAIHARLLAAAKQKDPE